MKLYLLLAICVAAASCANTETITHTTLPDGTIVDQTIKSRQVDAASIQAAAEAAAVARSLAELFIHDDK